MAGYKLARIYNATWRDPTAVFTIERHGDLDGEIQTWRADLARGSAECVSERSLRPPRPKQSPLDEQAVAGELARLIRAGADDPRLRWQTAHRRAVAVNVSKALPPGSAPATAGQAARLKAALSEALGSEWVRERGLWVREDRS